MSIMAQSAIGFGLVPQIKGLRSGVHARGYRGANKDVGQRKRYKAIHVIHSGRGPPSLKCANQNQQPVSRPVLPPEEEQGDAQPNYKAGYPSPQQPGGYGYGYPPYNQGGYPPGYPPQQAAYPYPYPGYPPQHYPQYYYPPQQPYPQYYYPPQQPYPQYPPQQPYPQYPHQQPYPQYYYPPQQPYPPPAPQSNWPTLAHAAALASLAANAEEIVSGITDMIS